MLEAVKNYFNGYQLSNDNPWTRHERGTTTNAAAPALFAGAGAMAGIIGILSSPLMQLGTDLAESWEIYSNAKNEGKILDKKINEIQMQKAIKAQLETE